MKGFSSRNLKNMRDFAQAVPDELFVQEVLAQIIYLRSRLLHRSLECAVRRYAEA